MCSYCKVFVNGEEVGKTDIVESTCFPAWNQDVMMRGFLAAPQMNTIKIEARLPALDCPMS